MSIKVKRFRAQPMSRLLHIGRLAPLLDKAQIIKGVQEHLHQHLPAELAEHVFVGGFHQSKLTLLTDRAAWLTRLRYEQRQLLKLIQQYPGLESITSLTLKVRPIRPPTTPIRQPRHLPALAASELHSCAESVEDPKLRNALLRLAAHAHINNDT
ncbi:DUF721 domain-containing protein [Halomonas halocynthiae]|uniref:DUF721 domain-containing protein n=1 Tax=Halomonas halocynthiae TaxID=176290 RepID=UPI00054D06D1|nr:DciA family protein [Halomonas halocynthiae]